MRILAVTAVTGVLALAISSVVPAYMEWAASGTNVVRETDRYADTSGSVICTMDARACPDGTSVGRIGPVCEFAPCAQPDAAGRYKHITWRFVSTGEHKGVPYTHVYTTVGGTEESLGVFAGECSVQKHASPLLAFALCQVGAGGTQIAVVGAEHGVTIRVVDVHIASAQRSFSNTTSRALKHILRY
jgi:hypothetical protein